MPKRKKLPPTPDYINFPVDGKTIIQKSNPLQSLSETPLTLPELKILDVYLSRIDSHNPEKRYVNFEKGELEKLLGVSRILKEDLSKRLNNLFVAVTIRDENKPDGFIKIGLFEKAIAFLDSDGLWQVDLVCTASAMEYIFNIENLGYLRYRLKNIIDLTSRYSYVLYMYLENNRFRKSWEIPLAELRQLLNCTAERYNQFKYFNSEILKKSQQELHKKTSLKFSYESVKKGRKVVAVKFTVETIADTILAIQEVQELKQDDNKKVYNSFSEVLNELEEEEEINYGGELANLLGGCACNDEFTVEQVRVLQDLVIKAVGRYADNLQYCDYLTEKIHTMNLYDSKKKIKDRFSYLRKMIEKDI